MRGKNQIFLRTSGHRDTWRTFFPKLKEKINIIKTLDYPEIINTNPIKNKKLKFGVIGQIRFGKSLEFLNDFFNKQTQYDFKILPPALSGGGSSGFRQTGWRTVKTC